MSFLNQSPARDAWLIFTAPIFSDPNVIITREEHDFIGDLKGLKGKSVALPRGTMVEERVRRDFPNLSVVLTASEPESMKLVSERQADMTIRSLIVAAHAIKTEGLFNLKISGQIPEYTNHLRMGAHKTILRVNHAFSQISGYAPQEVIGKTPRVLRSDRHPPDFYDAIGATSQATGMWHGELWSQRKNGEVYPEQITITAVKDGTGQVTHHVAVLRDITERKRLEQEVNQLAFFDTLTQLPNRRLFGDRLGQALKRAQRTSSSVALMFVDLDKFKPINDTYGHEAGDFMLQTVAKRLMGCLRASDTAARVGGDEFLVLLPDIPSGPAALAVAEKICATLAGPCTTPEGIELCFSASIGIAIYPEHAGTEHELMRLGDRAMYEAKSAGGNRVQLHGSPEGEVCSSAV